VGERIGKAHPGRPQATLDDLRITHRPPINGTRGLRARAQRIPAWEPAPRGEWSGRPLPGWREPGRGVRIGGGVDGRERPPNGTTTGARAVPGSGWRIGRAGPSRTGGGPNPGSRPLVTEDGAAPSAVGVCGCSVGRARRVPTGRKLFGGF